MESIVSNHRMSNSLSDLTANESEKYNMRNASDLNTQKDSTGIQFICAPYQGNDGNSGGGGGGDGPTSRLDKIFGGWLSVRISEHKELVPIIKTVYQWNILQNSKIVSIWSQLLFIYSLIIFCFRYK